MKKSILHLACLAGRRASCILFLAFCFLLPVSSHAAIPKLMTYQGVLKDGSGSVLTGTYSMTFRIYAASMGGTALWNETQSGISVNSGKFNVQLGKVSPLNIDFTNDYWLSVQIGTDVEMSPRVRLTSVGYAYMADAVVNGFTQSQHDALSHKNIEGVKDNTALIAKTNFKVDASNAAGANNLGSMIIDTFTDASGIAAANSSNYTWRGSSNYDVVVSAGSGGSYDAQTVLMFHFNGDNNSTTIIDSSDTPHTSITANGGAQLVTSQSKFGGASAFFNRSTTYLSVPDSGDFDFSGGVWTVDAWVRIDTTAGDKSIFGQDNPGADFFELRVSGGGDPAPIQIWIYDAGNGGTKLLCSSGAAISLNQWHHAAFEENGDSYRVYVDGALKTTCSDADRPKNYTQSVGVGRRAGNYDDDYFGGYIDELRVSKGVARYNGLNFTVPGLEYGQQVNQGTTATVVSSSFPESVVPSEAFVIADETLGSGTITYYVSRDNGTTWTQCNKEVVTNIASQPSGTQLKWKAEITGDAELNGIAVAV